MNASDQPETKAAAELRHKAEERLEAKRDDAEINGPSDLRNLIHELQVHQIELEMQNEELHRTRLEAEQARDKYYDLFDSAPVAYFLWNVDGSILDLNQAAVELLGVERRVARQMTFTQFVVHEYQARFRDFLTRVLLSDKKATCELQVLRFASTTWALIEGIAAVDGQQPQRVCRAAVIDVSQQKRADRLAAANEALRAEMSAHEKTEALLQAAKLAAEQANRAKDHFLAALSHELRTPLTPVLMGISILHERTDLAPDARETLNTVRRNVETEAHLIDDLLDVARIARGTIALARRPAALKEIIDRAVEVCRGDAEAHNLGLKVDTAACGPCWVEADASRLQQVFWNLLNNSIKFTPAGGRISIRCQISNEGDNADSRGQKDSPILADPVPGGHHEVVGARIGAVPSHAVVEVEDTGIGIDPEEAKRLFSAFAEANRYTSRQYGGLGLGLTISKTLVEMHGGTIAAESAGRGKGAMFRVRLPLTAPPAESSAPLAVAPPTAVRPLRILLVEDHAVTAMMLKTVLVGSGHAVEVAGDVAAALDLAGRQPFDLLLSDLGLPDGSGHDLLRELRAGGKGFPAVALSGFGQEVDVRRSRDAGFAAHLTKPANRETLAAAIAASVAR